VHEGGLGGGGDSEEVGGECGVVCEVGGHWGDVLRNDRVEGSGEASMGPLMLPIK
jgi:hypothetical protein